MAPSINNTWNLVRTKWETDRRRHADGWTNRHRNRDSEPCGPRQKEKETGGTDRQTDRQTYAAPQVRHQGVATLTAALVASVGVGAEHLTAAVLNGAFIDVWGQKETRNPSRVSARPHQQQDTAMVTVPHHPQTQNKHKGSDPPTHSSLLSVDL